MADVLIVDDEPLFRRIVHRWIDAEGLTVVEAESAEQALVIAAENPPRVAVCDVNMPRGQTGFWLVEQLRRLHPEIAIIISTGLHRFDTAMNGLRVGVTDYLVKPYSRDRLSHALANALIEHRTRVDTCAALGKVDGRECEMPEDAVRVEALVAILRTEDEAVARRALRVAHFASALGHAMGLSESELAALECAAVLRDLRRLDVHGIARNVRFLARAEAIVTATEERFDGTGFPLGLKGSSIPRGARILAVAEAYEAMVWGSGHGQLPPAVAVETLRVTRAHEFDPEVLQALSAVPQELALTH